MPKRQPPEQIREIRRALNGAPIDPRTSRLPEQIQAHITEMQQALQGEIVDLEQTAAGRDLLDLVVYLEQFTAQELNSFSHALGADHYHARALSFWQQKKGKRLQWQRGSLQAALAEYFNGSIERLESMLLDMTKQRSEPTTAIWIHPVPMAGNEGYFIYAMHHTGMTAAFEARDGKIRHLKMPPAAIQKAVDVLLRPRPSIMAHWANLVAQHAKVLEEAMRDDVTAFLARCGAQSLDEEKWRELMTLMFYREESVPALQDIVRLRTQSWVIEAQNLQNVVWRTIEKTGSLVAEKITNLEKQSTKTEKRLKSDLDKQRSLHEIAARRVTQLTRENHQLHKQLEKAGTTKDEGNSENNLGMALDRFFGVAN